MRQASPKGRRRHPLPPEDWPTRAEASDSRLFSPLRLASGLALDSRTWVPAMVPWRATPDGEVTEDVLEWYRRFAEGRPAAIVVEATGIRDIPSGPLLRVGHDRFVPGLRRLVDTVREASDGRTRLLLQVIDFLSIRRRPRRDRFLREFLQLTPAHRSALARRDPSLDVDDDDAVRASLVGSDDAVLDTVLSPRELDSLRNGHRERVTDTHLPHIAELPRVLPGLFADAAERARTAGFDGVELHFAHAYTMASFLSRLNDRGDGYGGPPENRVRLPLEVIDATRARVGRDWTVGLRYLGEEGIAGGSDLDDAIAFGLRFAEADVDFVSVSRGGKFEDARQPKEGEAAYPYTGHSGHLCMPSVFDERPPFGANLFLAAGIRRALRTAGHDTPVVASGGINGFRVAERALADGEADLIGAARQSLADPDWFLKVREGRGASVVRCLYTNYCEALDQQHRQVTCQLWDRLATEAEGVRLSEDGRRRLVAPRGDWTPRTRGPAA
jgi:2,4-dienoyl-CoA reductase-like NADH-dependent reductase (Old Yellow Enzyme family)